MEEIAMWRQRAENAEATSEMWRQRAERAEATLAQAEGPAIRKGRALDPKMMLEASDGRITMQECNAGYTHAQSATAGDDDEPEPDGRAVDGVPLAAKAAAKRIEELLPPDAEHPDDRRAAAAYAATRPPKTIIVVPATRENALRWVRGALQCKADGDKRYHRPLIYTIANPMLWETDEHNGFDADEPGFKELKAFCASKLDALGDKYEREVYAATKLGEVLKGVCADIVSVDPRQDVHAKLGPSEFRDEGGSPSSEADIIKLLVAAHALDPGFQAKAAQAFKEVTGKNAVKPPAVKRFARMSAQPGPPEPAENADISRTAWTLEDGAEVLRAEAKAREVFGTPLRCENNYRPEFDALKKTKGYRCMLVNYLYDSGKTWGEMQDEVNTAAAKVAELLASEARAIGGAEEDIDESREGVEKVRTKDFGGAMAGEKAQLVVEIRYMTKDYYAMGKSTHVWYKVVRADHAMGMAMDYAAWAWQGLDDD